MAMKRDGDTIARLVEILGMALESLFQFKGIDLPQDAAHQRVGRCTTKRMGH
jgi:hypothetical protein